MWWTKILSWGAGHWLPLAAFFVLVALLMGAYGLGRDHGSAAVKARWDAQIVTARVAADRATSLQNARLLASNGALKDAQEQLAAKDYALSVVNGQLRDYVTRPRNLPPPADFAECTRQLDAERHWSIAVGELLAEGADLAQVLGRERDDAVARLWAASDAWPR